MTTPQRSFQHVTPRSLNRLHASSKPLQPVTPSKARHVEKASPASSVTEPESDNGRLFDHASDSNAPEMPLEQGQRRSIHYTSSPGFVADSQENASDVLEPVEQGQHISMYYSSPPRSIADSQENAVDEPAQEPWVVLPSVVSRVLSRNEDEQAAVIDEAPAVVDETLTVVNEAPAVVDETLTVVNEAPAVNAPATQAAVGALESGMASRGSSPGVEMVAETHRIRPRPDLIKKKEKSNTAGCKNVGVIDLTVEEAEEKIKNDVKKDGKVNQERASRKRTFNTIEVFGKENVAFNVYVENSEVTHPLFNFHFHATGPGREGTEREGQHAKKQKTSE